METLPTSRRCTFSGTALKFMACATMLIDHIGASCIEAGLINRTAAPAGLERIDLVLRLIGRLAFPIFCFLLVEGFVHTHDVKKYVQRLFLFGVISEVPFDLAFFKTPLHWGHQNVYWTLALGVLAMMALQRFRDADGNVAIEGWAAAIGCAVLVQLAGTDYGATGVIIICALYLTRADRKRQCIVGAVLFAFEYTAPLAFVPIWRYNGQRGRCPKWAQWAFYLFYPVHLLVLAAVTNLIL